MSNKYTAGHVFPLFLSKLRLFYLKIIMCTRRIEFLSDTNSSHFKYCKCLRLRNYRKQLHNEELLNGTVLYDKFTNFLNNTKK